MATRLTDVRAFSPSGAGADLDDDKTLVLAFQSGDIDAYSDIFVKYRVLSAQICYRILQDREEADEAVQETMLRVYRGLPRFNGRYQLQAWVARIATNVSLDMVRARSRRPQRDPAKPDISDDAGLILALTDDTSETVERVLDQEEIRSTLESIPDRHRQALVLREFEGRSHEEIGDALGMSPKQAKALIHRAKKSFRRAWDQGGERRGVAALAPIIFLAPFRLPGFLRRLWQPAHDVVAGATATAQQAAIQVTAAPVMTQGAVTMADKVTAAAITVIVAGTVGVGAVAIRHTEKPTKPSPAIASSATDIVTQPVIVTPPVRSRPVAKPDHKPQHRPDHHAQDGPGQTGSVPAETPTESPAPAEPSSPTPGPESPQPLPAAPDWSVDFHSSVDIGTPRLSLISSHVLGGPGDLTFGQTIQGDTVDGAGKPYGFVDIEYNGQALQGGSSILSLWIWVDTPAGRFAYQATGSLTGVVQDSDGTTTYSFSAPYNLTDAPQAVGSPSLPMPQAGTATLTLKFWVDGSLFASGLSLTEYTP